jgi:hypothetical protein
MINSDANQDREPTITTVHNGVTHTEVQYAAWIQFDPTNTNTHISASSNSGGGWSSAVTLQGPRTNAGDPMLASNNYVGGFNPQTVYCVTNSTNPGTGSSGIGDNGLVVWQNSGSGWAYQQVESHTGTNYFQGSQYIDDRWNIDKPSIAVSQHANTAGAVYAAYLRNPINGSQSQQTIGFAMLDGVTAPAGQWKVRTDVPTPTPGSLQSPIVVVNQTSAESLGSVYVIYVDWALQRIYVYRTSDQGASWTSETYFDLTNTGVFLSGGSRDLRICTNRTNGDCVVAASIVSARYNWHSTSDTPSGSIGIVLNARDGSDVNTAKMHSYFFRWNPAPTCGGCVRGFDRGPIALTDATLESWDPALDYNSTGNYVMAWYRRVDNSTLQYKTEFAYVLNDGTLDHMITCASCRTSDPTRYPKAGGNFAYAIGEYQDIWYTSYLGYASSATIDIATSYGDVATYQVVP